MYIIIHSCNGEIGTCGGKSEKTTHIYIIVEKWKEVTLIIISESQTQTCEPERYDISWHGMNTENVWITLFNYFH